MRVVGPPLNEPMPLARLLEVGLSAKPDGIALAAAETQWTYRQLQQSVDRVAGGLLDLGLMPGDRVASLMPNRAALVIFYVACVKAGLVAVPLNYRYQPPEIDHALEVSGARAIFAHEERAADLAASKLAPALPLGRLSYGSQDQRQPSFEAMLAKESSGPFPAVEPESPVVIFFTSGSTGKPKGVTHTLVTLGWTLATFIQVFELSDESIVMQGSSISHIAGFGMLMSTLAAGGRYILPRTFDGDELLPLLREYRPTFLGMLPAALFALIRDHHARPEDFASIGQCMAGGDKVSAELEKEFIELAGIPVSEAYGMTEIGLATYNRETLPGELGAVGAVSPGYEMALRDDDGRELAAGQPGRLWCKSPCNMVGYWNHPQATAETIVDGFLDTGDIMRADEHGYLWFAGRQKQIIVHDGSNICPQEVEESLLEHPAVAGAGVIGIRDAVHGENVRAYIALKPGVPRPGSQELIRFSRARVGYKAPEEIILLDEMPLNATGKVDRVTLKRMAEERHEGVALT